jgi:hypothetical protein
MQRAGEPDESGVEFESPMKARSWDFPLIAAVAVMLFATIVITGIAYTYVNRPADWLHAVAHLFDHRHLPEDL